MLLRSSPVHPPQPFSGCARFQSVIGNGTIGVGNAAEFQWLATAFSFPALPNAYLPHVIHDSAEPRPRTTPCHPASGWTSFPPGKIQGRVPHQPRTTQPRPRFRAWPTGDDDLHRPHERLGIQFSAPVLGVCRRPADQHFR